MSRITWQCVYPAISILLGAFAAWIDRRFRHWGLAIVGLVLVFNFIGVYRASALPDGLTTQFAPFTRFNNEADDDLMAFLQEHELNYGYTNYWVAFRLAFLSDETLIYAPLLPYHEDRSYTKNDNRYPQYAAIVDVQDRLAYITTQHPDLDNLLVERWHQMGVTFEEVQIGPYHVFYDLSQTVHPHQLDLYVER